jgi:6-phosphogluconolactonase
VTANSEQTARTVGAAAPASTLPTAFAEESLLIGSYTGDQGTATGIGVLSVSPAGVNFSGVAAQLDSPSFLAPHPALPVVYAVEESTARVRAYRLPVTTADPASGQRKTTSLEPLGEPWPAGAAACHASVSPDGAVLIVSCWGDGQVIAYRLDSEGRITQRTTAEPATDPYSATGDLPTPPGIPRVSRAHCSVFLNDGRILTSDLGFDTVRIWHRGENDELHLDQELPLGQNAGPRHLAVHPSGSVLVVTEYSIEVVIVAAAEDGQFEIRDRTPATLSGAQSGDAAAEISLGVNARLAYVSVRGSDLIGVLAVAADGESSVAVSEFSCGGTWPRHHLVHNESLLVANQISNTVASFRLDPVTGLPAAAPTETSVPSPTCILALPVHATATN